MPILKLIPQYKCRHSSVRNKSDWHEVHFSCIHSSALLTIADHMVLQKSARNVNNLNYNVEADIAMQTISS